MNRAHSDRRRCHTPNTARGGPGVDGKAACAKVCDSPWVGDGRTEGMNLFDNGKADG